MATPAVLADARDLGGVGEGIVMLLGKREFVFGDGTGDGVAAILPVCNIAPNVVVNRVDAHITVGFDGTGDILTVGDGDDADGYIEAADWTESAEARISSTNIGGATDHPYQLGRVYPLADAVDLSLETNSDTTTGAVTVYVYGSKDDKETAVEIQT